MLSFVSLSTSFVAPGGLRAAPLDVPRAYPAIVQASASDLEALGVKGLPIEKTVRGFQMVPDQKLKYQQLLFLAKKLPDMDEALCVDERRVPGCLSVVYVHCTKDDEGLITFEGTSDAQLTKGLVALLVNGLSGCTNEQIQGVQPAFIEATGLQQSLTPGRNNVSDQRGCPLIRCMDGCCTAGRLPSALNRRLPSLPRVPAVSASEQGISPDGSCFCLSPPLVHRAFSTCWR